MLRMTPCWLPKGCAIDTDSHPFVKAKPPVRAILSAYPGFCGSARGNLKREQTLTQPSFRGRRRITLLGKR